MIKSVIKSQSGMVLVFDERGRQMSEYQGQYEEVRGRILADVPPDALFWRDDGRQLKAVSKEEW